MFVLAIIWIILKLYHYTILLSLIYLIVLICTLDLYFKIFWIYKFKYQLCKSINVVQDYLKL